MTELSAEPDRRLPGAGPDSITIHAAPVRGPFDARRRARFAIRAILLGVALIFVIRTFIVEAFRIPTGSMERTLLAGDFILVNKAAYGTRLPFLPFRIPGLAQPGRGDVVVFTPPHDAGKHYVKRLIGLPGDTVEMARHAVRVNGVRIDEPYARNSGRADVYPPGSLWQCRHTVLRRGDWCHPSRDSWGPIVVPSDRYLVLGDNRDESEDSRYWGFVPRQAIRGRPLLVYFSFDPGHDRDTHAPLRIRWDRIGLAIH
jgi:signal peptidase I